MRSIRRTSIGYLLVLLVLALGGVSLLIDQFARDAIRAREVSEADRIAEAFERRKQEANAKFDAELRTEAKSLARELGQVLRTQPPRNREEDTTEYRLRALSFLLASPGSGSGSAAYGYSGRTSIWTQFQSPRPATRLRDMIKKAFEDEDHTGYYQFHVVQIESNGTAHTVGLVRPPRLGGELPLNVDAINRDPQFEEQWDTVGIPEKGSFRRIVIPVGGVFPVWVAQTSPVALLQPGPGGGSRPGFGPPRRPEDHKLRIYVQAARPQADLDERIAVYAGERDEQLTRVQRETRTALVRMRAGLAMIGGFAFFALLAGGWVVIGRGLAPVGKLSVAVSQVSEKDFHLPHDGKDLPAELAPIHARINQTLDLLRRAFAREKQSVADISHELRTPIASLLAIFDVTLRKPRTPDQYRNALEDCRGITKQLGQLVERIMTLASLDAGTARTVSTRTDAAEVALGCAAVIRPLAEAHNLRFDIDAPEQVELDTDPDKLREVLINLLHNAVEYNEPGGHVGLSVQQDGDRVICEVRDTGIGMPSDVKERIFERFYRADSSRHATGVHAGLGLSIVKEYVERLHGTITVESEPGKGTTFRVLLPAANPDAADPEADFTSLSSRSTADAVRKATDGPVRV